MSKRRQRSASTAEPAPKKVRRDLITEVSHSEDIPAVVEVPREEDITEEDIPLVRPPRSSSRDRRSAEEGELVDRATITDEDEQIDIMSGGDVDIPGIYVRPGSLLAHEGRDEVQQPGSPSVFITSPRAVDPSPTTGVIGGKAPVAEVSREALSSSSLSGESEFEDVVDYGDEPTFPDPRKFSHISEEEMYGGESSTVSQPAIVPAGGTLFTF